jgi:cobalt-zinc-cadmium efflux system membrane fusion protein
VVDNISDAVDPQSLTLKVRVVLPNPHHRLKPQMYATVSVADRSRNAIVVPATAVIRDGITTYVFVQTGENKYARRDVQVGDAHDTTVEITGGLNEGDRVISTGAELLRGAGSE